MRGFDTVSCSVPRDALRWCNQDHFTTKQTIKGGEIVGEYHELSKKAPRPLGLVSMRVFEDHADVAFSAKILGQDYIRGINSDTIEGVPERIGRTGIVDFDPNLFVEGAKLYRIDATTNIRPSNLRDAIYASSLGSMNKRWNHVDYGRSRDDGFVYTSRLTRNKIRVQGYDKYREMTSRKQIKHADELGAEMFRDMLRVETQLKTYKDIRDRLGIETLLLTDALSTQRNPNLEMFDEIVFSMTPDQRLVKVNRMFNDVKELGMRLFKEITTMHLVFEACGGDWSQIERFVRSAYAETSEPKREIKKWKTQLAGWNLSKQLEGNERSVRVALEEVRDLLKAA